MGIFWWIFSLQKRTVCWSPVSYAFSPLHMFHLLFILFSGLLTILLGSPFCHQRGYRTQGTDRSISLQSPRLLQSLWNCSLFINFSDHRSLRNLHLPSSFFFFALFCLPKIMSFNLSHILLETIMCTEEC